MADEQAKVPVYFIGVEYPPNIGTLSYTVRGKTYTVPRDSEGAPDVGAALMADPNDIEELINKARYFNGQKNVEVFTTDKGLAASAKKSFKDGRRIAIEARMGGVGGDVVVAPTKQEILGLLSDDEIIQLARQRGLQTLPTDLSASGQFAPNADESALARAAKVQAEALEEADESDEDDTTVHGAKPMSAAEKRAAKKQAELEMAKKLEQ